MATLYGRLSLAYVVLVAPAIAATALVYANLGARPAFLIALIVAVALIVSVLMTRAIARETTGLLARLRSGFETLAAGRASTLEPDSAFIENYEIVEAFNALAASLRQRMLGLEQARSRLEALLAASQDAIAALDAHGTVRYLNSAGVALYGSIEGRSFAEAARDPAVTGLLRAALPGRMPQAIAAEPTGTVIYIDHRDAWVQVTASAIAGGGDWAVLLVLHDITEVRRAETTRRDFVANVSHELRTPLAGIKAVVETLRDGALDDTETAHAFLGQVDGEVDRLVQLVEELLQLARVESGAAVEMTPVDLRLIMADCLERYGPQAERAGVQLHLQAPESLPLIKANAGQLGQAFGNLVHNAIKFTPSGGEVTVSARTEGTDIRIAVTDTGDGIDAADLPRIFERFYIGDRARTGRGTGLGLAIVKHVALAHHGSVEAKSVRGRGSTFTISLPVTQSSPTPLPAAAPHAVEGVY